MPRTSIEQKVLCPILLNRHPTIKKYLFLISWNGDKKGIAFFLGYLYEYWNVFLDAKRQVKAPGGLP
ncbi:MAG: hypothetical protein KKA10_15860 [Euryarchaeota archaeon]|nr:hypothetical protein [Euryarchaeota archaeon]